MDDSSDVLALLAADVPAGPREHELMSLHELAESIRGRSNLDGFHAAHGVVRALLGDDELQGLPPASLAVYRCFMSVPELLAANGPEWEGFKYPAPRRTALRRLLYLLRQYPTIDDIPEGSTSYDEVAGRFLAVVRADALRAFGLEPPARSVQTSAPAPAEPTAAAEPVPLHLVQPEPEQATAPTPAPAADIEDLHSRRRRAVVMLRKLEGQGLKRVRQQVADVFGINPRTVGKWLEDVEKEEAAARAENAFSAGLIRL